MRFNKAIFMLILGGSLCIGTPALAHPGRTASDGCHYCWTNCAKWGEEYGVRHCHNGTRGDEGSTFIEPTIWHTESQYLSELQHYKSSAQYKIDQLNFLKKNCFAPQCDSTTVNLANVWEVEVLSGGNANLGFSMAELDGLYFIDTGAVVDSLEDGGNYPAIKTFNQVMDTAYPGQQFNVVTVKSCISNSTLKDGKCYCDPGYVLKSGTTGYIANGPRCISYTQQCRESHSWDAVMIGNDTGCYCPEGYRFDASSNRCTELHKSWWKRFKNWASS